MEAVKEDEEYSWREVKLPSLIPIVPEPELERETGERRRGRDIVIAVDHGPNSKHAFDWAIAHLCRLADTIHLVHVVSSVSNDVMYQAAESLMEKLAVEAFEVAMVRTYARIAEGDPGKVICKEAERVKPAAVVMGTRGRGIIQSSYKFLVPSLVAVNWVGLKKLVGRIQLFLRFEEASFLLIICSQTSAVYIPLIFFSHVFICVFQCTAGKCERILLPQL